MAASKLSPTQRSYLRYLGYLQEKPREPEPDFDPPPPYPVVWLVVDRNCSEVRYKTAVAQTAYRAWELAGVTRDGQRVAYAECHVFISERLTEQMRKLNGKTNGKGASK